MDVPPHPHTGLQTVSWLFSGEIEHRDSGGHHALVRPGEMNLMTGGHGIAHSEVSTPGTRLLHGVQLWVALPDAARDEPRAFQHHVLPAVHVTGATARVFLGTLLGQTSPVRTFTPLLGAEITLDAGAHLTVGVDTGFEHGVLADTDGVSLEGAGAAGGTRLHRAGPARADAAQRRRRAGSAGAPRRHALRGGHPHGGTRRPLPRRDRAVSPGVAGRGERFGRVEGYEGRVSRPPAPELPPVRIRPRQNPPAADRARMRGAWTALVLAAPGSPSRPSAQPRPRPRHTSWERSCARCHWCLSLRRRLPLVAAAAVGVAILGAAIAAR